MVFVSSAIALGTSIAASTFGAAIGLAGVTSSFALAAVGFGTQFLLGAALSALTPKPSLSGASRGYQVNARGSALDHQIIYGKVRVGGAIVYDEATGTNNKFLHRIIAVAGHEVESFDEIYINDEIVTLAPSTVTYTLNIDALLSPVGFNSSTEYYLKVPENEAIYEVSDNLTQEQLESLLEVGEFSSDTVGYDPNTTVSIVLFTSAEIVSSQSAVGSGNVISPSRYNGKVRIKTHLGSSDQAADTDLVAESDKWTAQHRLRGIAYMYVRLAFDADVFPNGVPTITATVKGKKVYNPDTDTTVWSDNPALCLRDYLTSGYGLAEVPSNIDDTLVTAASTVCSQTDTDAGTTRYTCNGAFTTSVTPYEAINNLLTSMGGTLWYAQGKWRMKPAYWTASVLDLNEDDLRSSISVATRHSRRDNFNAVKGTFRGEESNWQTTDYPQVDNIAFLEADNGQESVADVDLPFTDNSIEARRLSRITLERNRQQLTVTASFGIKTMQAQVGDVIRLTNVRFGWTNKEFEVLAWNFGLTDGLDLQVDLTLRETAESVFDEVDDGIVYEKDNTNLESAFTVPPVGLSAVVRTQVIREKLTNIVTLTVSSGAGERIDYVEAEFKLSSEDIWISLGTGQLGEFKAIDLEDGDYDFRARAINTFGVKGEWEFLSNINASGLLEPPSDVENFVAEVNGTVITLDWDAVPDLDLSFYRVRYSPEVSGATWANSTTYVDKVSRPASSVSVPARSGTYLVRAYDKSGVGSINYTSVVVPVADIEPLANTLSLTDSPTFTGTKTNTSVVSSELRLSSFGTAPSTGDYLFSNYIETGDSTVKRCRVYVSATNSRVDTSAGLFDDQGGFFDSAPGLFDDLGGDSQFADTNVTTLVSTTQDDPSGTPTWTTYTPIKVADISARAFRFKVTLTSTSANITPSVSALTAYVEYN